MSKTFTKDEVASHKSKDDLWSASTLFLLPPHSDIAGCRVIVDDDAYDLTKFQEEHPGGQKSKQLPQLLTESAFVDPLCPSSPAGSRQGCLKAVLEVP